MGFSLVTCDWSHSLCAGLSEEEASTAPFHCHIYSPAADPSISSALVSSLVSAIEQLTDKILLLETTQGRELKAIKLHVISLEEVNSRLVQEISTLKKAVAPKPSKPRPINQTSRSAGAGEFPSSNTPFLNHHRPPSSFRIVWGTKFACPDDIVKNTITSKLPSESAPFVTIKKSVKLNSAGRRKWWFTIIAPPEILSMVDEGWDSLECPPHWRLLSKLSDLAPPAQIPLTVNPPSSERDQSSPPEQNNAPPSEQDVIPNASQSSATNISLVPGFPQSATHSSEQSFLERPPHSNSELEGGANLPFLCTVHTIELYYKFWLSQCKRL